MTPRDKALALAAIDCFVFPAREKDEIVKGRDGKDVLKLRKTPHTWSGHLEATTDPQKIAQWWDTWPEALVGVNAGMSRLVTADIDMGADEKTGEVHDGWGNLEEAGLVDDLPPTETYQTARGGDHYVYAAPEGVPLGPTQNHETPEGVAIKDVDRRGGSSYFLWWGETVPTTRDVFKEAPAWLLTPAREARTTEAGAFSGSIEEWFAKCVPGEASAQVRGYLEEMVDKQGQITHQEMIDFQRFLVGEAADNLEPGIPGVLRSFRDIYTDYPADSGKDWGREFDVALAGGIAKFGAFALSPRDILAREKGDAWIRGVDGELLNLLITLPAVQTPESLRQRVAYLMSRAISDGKEVLDAATLGWASASAKAPGGIRESMPQAEGLAEVWNLAWQVAARPVGEEPVALPPIVEAAVEPTLAPGRRVCLLTDGEAARAVNLEWWGTEFMARMREWNDPINEQYFHLSQWIILSLAFAPAAHMVTRNGTKIPLNFYGIVVGPSASGKSESIEIVRQLVDVLEMGNEWDLGGDATAAGLTQALVRRHVDGGGATLLHPDEADATLRNWSDERGPFADMKQRITDIYMGRVPKFQRTTGAKDLANVAAEAYLNVHLSGVKDKIADAILPDDWESGFINRFVWAVGTKSRLSDEQLEMDLLEDETGAADHSAVTQWVNVWATRFRGVLTFLTGPDMKPSRIGQADEVKARHGQTWRRFEAIAARMPGYESRLLATFDRLWKTTMKCAALVAITHKRRRIEMDDYLIALRQAEEWATNILELIEATDETPMARHASRLAGEVRASGGRMALHAIHRMPKYAGRSKDVKALLDELIAQGRAEILDTKVPGTDPVVRLIEKGC